MLICCAILPAQTPAEIEKAGIPFDQWVAEGNVAQIPWRVEVSRAHLGLDQRLRVGVKAVVDGKMLNRRGDTHDLSFVVRVRVPDGAWFPTYAMLRQELGQPLPARTEIEFLTEFYAAPGRYQVIVLLYDGVKRERSLQQQLVNVQTLKDDPLPDAFRGMPGVEFLRDRVSEQINFSYNENGRLRLPVKSQRPVRVELLVNLDRTEAPPPALYESPFIRRARRTRPVPASGTAVLLSVLKALSDLRVESGSLNLMALDLNRRVIAFQQDGIQQLDWPALLEAVKKNNEPTISASALGGQHQNAAFFREVLETKLAGDLPVAPITGCSRSADAKPIRVIIVLSEAMIFAPGSDLKPLAANSDCNCRVFHLRYLRTAISAFDELDRIIKPLKPQRFEITTPLDLRRALRKILDEIGKL